MTLSRIQFVTALVGLFVSSPPARADDLYIGSMKINKILFLGNSITSSPAQTSDIGWWGTDWGMAASAPVKDYVHILLSDMAALAGGTPEARVKTIVAFERDKDKGDGNDYNVSSSLSAELNYNADVVVVAIGENAGPDSDARQAYWRERFTNLLTTFKNTGSHPTVFVRSMFWSNADNKVVDDIMEEVTAAVGGLFVNISSLDDNPLNFGRAELGADYGIGGKYEAVGNHPGDAGMAAIAGALQGAMVAHAAPEPGALVLLATAGLLGLLACGWRKRK